MYIDDKNDPKKILPTRYARIFNNSPFPYLTLSKKGEILNINKTASNLLAIKQKDFLNQPFIQFIAKNYQTIFKNYLTQLFSDNPNLSCIIYLEFNKKKYSCTLNCLFTQSDSKAVFSLSKIDEIKSQKIKIESNAYQNLSVALVVFDNQGIILSANTAFCNLIHRYEENLIGKNLENLSLNIELLNKTRLKKLQDTGHWIGEISAKDAFNKNHFYLLKMESIYDENQIVLQHIAIIIDIAKQKSTEQKIQHQADYDGLTNLPNFRLFNKLLSSQIKIAKSNNEKFVLLFLDIDKFKIVNDIYGHFIGDRLLKKFSTRLKKIIRSTDFLARTGGDEFYVLINNIKNFKFSEKIINKILKAMRKPFRIEQKNISIRISVGAAFFPETATNKTQLIRKCDMALLIRKSNHGDGVNF